MLFRKNGSKRLLEEAKKALYLIESAKESSNIYECLSFLNEFLALVEKSPQKEIYELEDAQRIILEKIYRQVSEKSATIEAIDKIVKGNETYRPIEEELTFFGLNLENITRYCIKEKLQERLKNISRVAKAIVELDRKGAYNLDLIMAYEEKLKDFAQLSNSLGATDYGITFNSLEKDFDASEIDRISVKARLDFLERLVKEKPQVLATDQVKQLYTLNKELVLAKATDSEIKGIESLFEQLDNEYQKKETEYAKIACRIQDKLYENALRQAELGGQQDAKLTLELQAGKLTSEEFRARMKEIERARQITAKAFFNYSREYMTILGESEEGLKRCMEDIEERYNASYYDAMHPYHKMHRLT